MGKVYIFIPSLNPDKKLLKVVNDLLKQTEYDIIVLDDGSNISNRHIFDEILKYERCHILRHAVNLGKGRALKDGFNYILNTYPDCIGVVTVDGDGQHTTKDIIRCAEALEENPDSLVLGSRDFDSENVPAKNGMGNKITRKTMKLLCGIDIPDTQTGLRGISSEFMKILMNVSGERFEFETNMLISAKENGIAFNIVPIDTVYIEDNASSHFNPIKDSIKIYAIFVKFLFASLSSSVIDVALFTVFIAMFKGFFPEYYIYIATGLARLFSSIYNFNMNKHTVFRNKEKNIFVAVRYFGLCIIQAAVSSICVAGIFKLSEFNESAIKIVVDVILFFISFQIQREWVFKKKQNEKNKEFV